MALARLSLRELQSRPARSLLTLLSIIIGAGAIVATYIASDSAKLAQRAMVQNVTGNAQLEIQAAGGGSFDIREVLFLKELDGIEVISPSVRRYSTLATLDAQGKPDRKLRVQLLGVDFAEDKKVRNIEHVAGKDPFVEAPSDEPEVWCDEGLAKSAGLAVGQEVKLLTKTGNQSAKIAGLLKSNTAASAFQSAVLMAPTRTIQKWTRSTNKLDVVQLMLSDEKRTQEIQTKIAEKLPQGVYVREPPMRSELANESTVAIQRGLLIATIFSLVMAGFIIFNTFQMNVGERRRQLGILRAIGTTRKQVLWMVLREAAILGVLGSILGCFVGYFGADLLNQSTATLLGVSIPSSSVGFLPIALAIACGFLVSLVGASLPAMTAAKASPSEAMKSVSESDSKSLWALWFVIGWIVIALGLLILWASTYQYITVRLGTAGIVMIILGVIFLLPASLPLLTKIAAAPLMAWMPVEAALARRQVLRHPGRSAMTIGILLVAMAMGLGMAFTILDNIRDVQFWYKRTIVGDFFVRAAMPDMSSGHAADMPEGFPEKVAAVDGILTSDTMRFVSARAGELSVIAIVRQFNSPTQDYFDLVQGKEDQVMQGIRQGQVVLGSVLAERAQLNVGDEIELETNEGKVKVPIVGVTNEYLAGGLTLYMQTDQAKRLLSVDGTDAVIVRSDPSKRAQVKESLQKLADSEGLMVQSFQEMADIIENMISGVVGGLWVVLALGALIAAFGLINTLAMNILEQTREIGMLRVVAMTRQQIRRMILAQALIMAFIGILPGVVLGVGVAAAMNLSTLIVTGHAVRFQWYPGFIAGALLAEVLIVIMAAMFPAERAARLNLAKALQYE
ncbi:MAG: ABC transporter permease [Planctomycetes bacterium]|nr:ABC transporter permease [Planctomycetota bacterium]